MIQIPDEIENLFLGTSLYPPGGSSSLMEEVTFIGII